MRRPLPVLAAVAAAAASAAPAPAHAHELSLRQADVELYGTSARDSVASVAGLGDVNGDGRPDVAIAAGRRVHVLFGPVAPGSRALSAPRARRGFTITGGRGLAVDRAGDVDGDGLADVLLRDTYGAFSRRTDHSAYVVFGRRSASAVDVQALGSRGFRIAYRARTSEGSPEVAGGADLNGDGRADVVVTVPHGAAPAGQPSRAYVVFGRGGGGTVDVEALGAAGYRVEGGERLRIVAPAAPVADVGGDGRAELALLVEDTARRDANEAQVVHGSASVEPVVLASPRVRVDRVLSPANERLYALADAGDVDTDGRGDVLLASTHSEGDLQNTATVHVVYGGAREVDLGAQSFRGYRHATGWATALANAGDVDGDGRPDALLGVPYEGGGRFFARGYVEVLLGRRPGTAPALRSYAVDSAAPNADGGERGHFTGTSVAGAGDQNGDGRADLLVASHGFTRDPRRVVPVGAAHVVFSPKLVVGTERDDVLVGTGRNDLLVGLGGNDVLRGGGGNDALVGGAGDDRLSGADGRDRLLGGAGRDRLAGGFGADDLFGDGDRDHVVAGADTLLGGPGDDLLAGGAGNDALDGGDGLDRAFGGDGADRVAGGGGDDLLVGDGTADWALRKLDAIGQGSDVLLGGRGRDVLWGGGGGDGLYGHAGNDVLRPGPGRNLADGGPGRDAYVRAAGAVDRLVRIEVVLRR